MVHVHDAIYTGAFGQGTVIHVDRSGCCTIVHQQAAVQLDGRAGCGGQRGGRIDRRLAAAAKDEACPAVVEGAAEVDGNLAVADEVGHDGRAVDDQPAGAGISAVVPVEGLSRSVGELTIVDEVRYRGRTSLINGRARYRSGSAEHRIAGEGERPGPAEKPTVDGRAVQGKHHPGWRFQRAAGEVERARGRCASRVPQRAGWVDSGVRDPELGVVAHVEPAAADGNSADEGVRQVVEHEHARSGLVERAGRRAGGGADGAGECQRGRGIADLDRAAHGREDDRHRRRGRRTSILQGAAVQRQNVDVDTPKHAGISVDR